MQALNLNCPELNDLNLNSCNNLHPGMCFNSSFSTFKYFLMSCLCSLTTSSECREIATSMPQFGKRACIRLPRNAG